MPRSSPGVIETGLHCAACGYNLRGLRHDGNCPECGRRIEDVVDRSGLRLASYRSIRRTRLGIALWVVSLVLPPLGMIAFSAAIFISPSYWSDRQSGFWWIYRASIYAWGYASSAAGIVFCLSVILITFPPRRQFERFESRLGCMAVALALVGVAYSVFPLHKLFRGQLWWIAPGGCGLAPCVTWIYLTLRLHQQRCRRLRKAMWSTLAALGLIALASPWRAS